MKKTLGTSDAWSTKSLSRQHSVLYSRLTNFKSYRQQLLMMTPDSFFQNKTKVTRVKIVQSSVKWQVTRVSFEQQERPYKSPFRSAVLCRTITLKLLCILYRVVCVKRETTPSMLTNWIERHLTILQGVQYCIGKRTQRIANQQYI